MAFTQSPPQLGNQYTGDRILRSYLARVLPPAMLEEVAPQLIELGGLAGGELYRLQLADRLNEPVHVPWDAWGNRIDQVELSPLWREAARLAATRGIIATAYERHHGMHSRVHHFALAYLFTPSTDLYSCPLAMSDGAAAALNASGNEALIERAVPRLTSRDPDHAWTSGQWMTEAAGGSDVGLTETVARQEAGTWRLYGRKWFTSSINSPMALTLARPEGSPAGGKGLALFYLETRDAAGRPNGIVLDRLKDKLGTRKVPTAELTLEGVPAQPVNGLADGVRHIAPMLNITRVWNSVSACALMRRGIALARDFAGKRVAFGTPLAQKPLHVDTLAGMQAEFEAAFHLTFFVVELLGRAEAGQASAGQTALLRLMTPIAKLVTGKQAVAVLSEAIEAFGGAGYIEDTGLPLILRDAHVLPIWEGTTNVLALDALRALDAAGGLAVVRRELGFLLQGTQHPALIRISALVEQAGDVLQSWLDAAGIAASAAREAGARRFALLLGRTFALALAARHAQWLFDHEHDTRGIAAARRLAAASRLTLTEVDAEDARRLALDSDE